jgi:hypothetical protein
VAVVWPTVVAKDPKVDPVAVECEAGPAAPQPAEPAVPAEPKVEPAELVEAVLVVPRQAHLRPSLAHLVPHHRAHQAHRRLYHQLLLLRKMPQVSAVFEDSVYFFFAHGVYDVIFALCIIDVADFFASPCLQMRLSRAFLCCCEFDES